MRPRSVAVVGASDRPGSYGDATLRNLAALGFPGPVWGVHPARREVHGRPCVPALDDLPEAVDAVVVAIPAAGVPEVARAAGRRGCGGLVVFAAGFAEAGEDALQASLRKAAEEFALPVVGPNCDGLVAFHARAALWGDALVPRPAGRVALISQSGNVAVNALSLGRGLRFHTVASVGNQAVVDAAMLLEALVEEDGVGSVALFLESDGDGARLAGALARAAERDIGVAVLKVGATAAGASAAAAHTGALAGDQRVFRALVEEAGAAWADDVHDLLELAKAMAVPRRRSRDGGLAILTCSGGDSGLAADEAGRRGIPLAPLGAETAARLERLLPAAATVGNPLDYTAMIWGERERLAAIVRAVADDPAVGDVLLYYDEPPGMDAGLRASWDAVREGLADGAAHAAVPALVASTLPELLQDDSAAAFLQRGVPAVAGLRTALACVVALRRPPGDPARLCAIAAAAGAGTAGPWLSEADAKALLAAAGIAVPPGRVAADEDDAVAAARELGGPVAVKACSAALRHKSDAGALELGVLGDDAVRAAYRRVLAAGRRVVAAEAPDAAVGAATGADATGAPTDTAPAGGADATGAPTDTAPAGRADATGAPTGADATAAPTDTAPAGRADASGAPTGAALASRAAVPAQPVSARREAGDVAVLVEAMAAPGVELLVAARRDAVVPALVVGLGGIWTESLDDVAIVPLPASPTRVEAALRTLRGFALLGGARGRGAVDVEAVARLGAAAGELLLGEGLTLLELNPVVARPDGAVALDALARR